MTEPSMRILGLRERSPPSLMAGLGCLRKTDKQNSFQMDGLTFSFSVVKMKIKELVCPHPLCTPSPSLPLFATNSNLNLMVPPRLLLNLKIGLQGAFVHPWFTPHSCLTLLLLLYFTCLVLSSHGPILRPFPSTFHSLPLFTQLTLFILHMLTETSFLRDAFSNLPLLGSCPTLFLPQDLQACPLCLLPQLEFGVCLCDELIMAASHPRVRSLSAFAWRLSSVPGT